MSTYGFSDLDAEMSVRRREILQRTSFLLLIFIVISFFACKSASTPGDVSANAKTLCCIMFSDSGVPKTLFFAMSSDSEVPWKGRAGKWKLVECV